MAAASALFGGADLAELDEQTLASVVAEIGGVELGIFDEPPSLVDVLERSGVVQSRSAARRAILEGGAYVNNRRVADPEATIGPEDLLHGRFVILRRGRKTVCGCGV